MSLTAALADWSGVPEPALTLLLAVLAGFPLALGHRLLCRASDSLVLRNVYTFITGLGVAWFAYGINTLHSLLTVLVTYALIRFISNRQLSVVLSFTFNVTYLLVAYSRVSTDSYDIDWTTPQAVMTLRLIGLTFDYMDGAKSAQQQRAEKVTGLQHAPSLLETLAYCYFYGAFLVGPVLPFTHYQRWISSELFHLPASSSSSTATSTRHLLAIPSAGIPALRCVALGALYLGLNQIGTLYFPAQGLLSDGFALEAFVKKVMIIWITCKICLCKYLGIWLLNETTSVLSGIGFSGYDATGKSSWDAASNVRPWLWETASSLGEIINSFNIRTNEWVKCYIFKRLIFLKSRNLSSLGALVFLAVWHGFSFGYFNTFFLEFVDMEAERRLQLLSSLLMPSLKSSRWLSSLHAITGWVLRNLAMHLAFISFELLAFDKSHQVLMTIYYASHLALLLVPLLDFIILPAVKRISIKAH